MTFLRKVLEIQIIIMENAKGLTVKIVLRTNGRGTDQFYVYFDQKKVIQTPFLQISSNSYTKGIVKLSFRIVLIIFLNGVPVLTKISSSPANFLLRGNA